MIDGPYFSNWEAPVVLSQIIKSVQKKGYNLCGLDVMSNGEENALFGRAMKGKKRVAVFLTLERVHIGFLFGLVDEEKPRYREFFDDIPRASKYFEETLEKLEAI